MKVSQMLAATQKEDPQEAEILSHKLMHRTGMLRRVASGVFNYLPLGLKVIRKIENIIREEMNAIGGQELLMPALNPRELWEETGRWEVMGDNLFRLKDRWGRDLCLGMTHEEIVTDIARKEIHSYKNLPISLYQIQTKFRDEPRPRGGVMRGREFIMKDAYSFHRNMESLDEVYRDYYRAYWRIFTRCGIETVAVEADPGPIGGTDNHEFMVISPNGEDTIYLCNECGYGANKEMAYFADTQGSLPSADSFETVEKIHTPDVSSIEKLTEFLKIPPYLFIKALVYLADKKPVMVLVRGDRNLNEVKLRRFLGVTSLVMASPEDIEQFTGGGMGFSGPVGMEGKEVIADHEIKFMLNAVCGANEEHYHLKGVNPGRDFNVSRFAQLRDAVEGDLCPKCGKLLDVKRSIELGHIFKLGRKYSDSLKAKFLDEDGQEKTFIMGCYGIGVTRIAAAVIDVHNDKDGIIWPITVAPYQCIVMPVISGEEEQRTIAENIYQELQKRGYEVLYDDRDSRPGFKFKDADLLGIPIRVVAGKGVSEGLVELKQRSDKKSQMVKTEEAVEKIVDMIEMEKAKIMLSAQKFEGCPC